MYVLIKKLVFYFRLADITKWGKRITMSGKFWDVKMRGRGDYKVGLLFRLQIGAIGLQSSAGITKYTVYLKTSQYI